MMMLPPMQLLYLFHVAIENVEGNDFQSLQHMYVSVAALSVDAVALPLVTTLDDHKIA